ncbi:MAG: hypothetical protein A3I04_01720 [Nitrospinae bacterium RIFCSPLOWO2_02_FULL_39_110]|nr:MAG: hypothetical protein A3D20_03975 [Nitrospinae bacterium RIFCSPHIGHO2_02_FULL_39_82]OGW05633.1 MAG: hypothetical protein A3I04_01720 [Nitrospinae bacterium RIFCSPLOWO2_02_FULL_39_110]OGW10863.1 MAG: hypothetical protein A3F81_04580 [Nitrospinae bacterium RIFCSPLOWO2_12_FULL_39_93]
MDYMKTSTAIKTRPYRGGYVGNLLSRQRKIQQIKSTIFITIKLILSGLFFLGIVTGSYKGYRYIVSSPYFNISDISIVGNVNLKREDILSLSGINVGQSIFSVKTNDIYKCLKDNFWIKDVSVRKELPDKFSIKINERVPVAILKSNGFYLMDDEGVVLAELMEGEARELPMIIDTGALRYKAGDRVSSEGVFRGIDIMKGIYEIKSSLKDLPLKEKISMIEPINHDRVKLYLRDKKDEYIIINNEDMIKKIRYLNIVMNLLNNESDDYGQKEFEYLDLSYKDKVIVKYKD